MTVMTKEEQEAKRKEHHWRSIGGVVYDVAQLLESLSRINDNQLNDYDTQHLKMIKHNATLVASHALRPVLAALNDEATDWMMKFPENI